MGGKRSFNLYKIQHSSINMSTSICKQRSKSNSVVERKRNGKCDQEKSERRLVNFLYLFSCFSLQLVVVRTCNSASISELAREILCKWISCKRKRPVSLHLVISSFSFTFDPPILHDFVRLFISQYCMGGSPGDVGEVPVM